MELSHVPFPLGQTLRGTDDDGALINNEVLGSIHFFYAVERGAADNRGNKTRRVGKKIKAIALRNNSGATLYGKRVAILGSTAGYSGITTVIGYAATLALKGVVIIDEFLATSGVADKDIFWGIIEGPVTVLTPVIAGADFNGDIAVGAQLVAATGTTTGATSCGRVSNVTFTAATAGNTSNGFDGFKMAANLIGSALSARTTGETAADLLINAAIKM